MSGSTNSEINADITTRVLRLLVEQSLVRLGQQRSIGPIGQALIKGRSKKGQLWLLRMLRI